MATARLNGTPRATLYEFPVAPLESLAQFRHANLAGSGYMPFVTYTVGESMRPSADRHHRACGEKWTDDSVMLDHTFLANEALWDSYYLSTVADQSRPVVRRRHQNLRQGADGFFQGQGARCSIAGYAPYNRDSTIRARGRQRNRPPATPPIRNSPPISW